MMVECQGRRRNGIMKDTLEALKHKMSIKSTVCWAVYQGQEMAADKIMHYNFQSLSHYVLYI